MRPRLLVSVVDSIEAMEAAEGGADIIDVKNPSEGSLGASYPWVIKEVIEVIPKGLEVSVAIGDMRNLPGLASIAAYGAAHMEVDYIKVGLWEIADEGSAIKLSKAVVKAVREVDSDKKVVLVGYGDYFRINSINPLIIPKIAALSEADVAMIDTAIKDGSSLLRYMNLNQLREFVRESHGYGLMAALAGSLGEREALILKSIGVDVLGFRGFLCSGDRVKGRISLDKVKRLKVLLEE